MKKFTPFETAILGFFVGVIASTYLAFLNSTSSFVGHLFEWISLMPVARMLSVPVDGNIVFQFLFVVLVFTLYGFLVGIFLQFTVLDRTKFVAGLLVLVVAGMGAEQYVGLTYSPKDSGFLAESSDHSSLQASVVGVRSGSTGQSGLSSGSYFGAESKTEAHGDLNADGKDDVAFLIPRKDETRGTIYYLAAALATDRGHAGTNLLFLGEEVVPKTISIKNGVIDIEYGTTHMYRKVVNGELMKGEKME